MRPFTPQTLHALHNSFKGISTARSHLHIFSRISTAKTSTCEYPITAPLPEHMPIKPPANIPIKHKHQHPPRRRALPRAENPRRRRPRPLRQPSLAQKALPLDRRRRVRRPAQPSPKAGSSTKRIGRVNHHPQSLPQSSPQLPAAGVADHGLQTAFSEIEHLSHSVKSAGNPISLDLRTRYVVRGLKKEHAISSVVNIYTNSAGRIEKVEDKWDGNLPDSSITNVSAAQLSSLW